MTNFTVLICSVGAEPLSLTFTHGTRSEVLTRTKTLAQCVTEANEVYAVRVWEGESLVFEWGGE